MKLKHISKLLILSSLLNSFNMNVLASTLSEDTRYETFNENNITIPDVLVDDNVSIKVEGSTLVNSVDYNKLRTNNFATINTSTKEIFFDSRVADNTTTFTDVSLFIEPSLKALETYTLTFEVVENTITSQQYFGALDSAGEYIPNEWLKLEPGTKGLIKIPFTVKANNNGRMKMYLRNPVNDVNRGIVKIKNLMILEGDWSNKDIPEYFEGMKSSFENNLVTQEMIDLGEEKAENLGKYKVEIKSTGKNLLPNSFLRETGKGPGVADGMLYPSMFGPTTNRYRSANLIPVKPNTQYTVNCTDEFDFAIGEFDESKRQLIDTGWLLNENNKTYTTSKNCKYIVLVIRKKNSAAGADEFKLEEISNKIQLEEGSVSTSYEPYKESVNTFYLNSPLLEGDTIEYINGQTYHVRRCKQIALKGDENWKIYASGTTDNFITFTFHMEEMKYGSQLINDYFKVYKHKEWNGKLGYEKCILGGSHLSFGAIYISIPRDELATEDVDGFKLWVQSNPVNVVYELAEPIYEPIKADLSVNLFEGTTHISNNSNISANMEVTVDRAINRAVEAIELANINPTSENISKARMWINLLDDSIKKDELQNEVNDITDISDLKLEPKTVTSNIDLYIKSANALSMSLNTNSIRFDNFSGVEDVEKLNAVEITINSSLPYNLNASLEGDIRNGDNSETIDKSIVNIRESSESNYQTFNNTKITLKANCPEGNYSVHSIDLMLAGNIMQKKDVYKTVIKFEAEQR